jgi:tRNA (mo5U34)-methyltransferase
MVTDNIAWFHSFDFGNGEIVNGIKPLEIIRLESEVIFSEAVSGKSVLDIGAWDGYFSFDAERRGAAEVLATDNFCWSGPGWGNKSGFDYAHAKFKSRVTARDIDVFDLVSQKVGVFDVVLLLGVLYHLKNPFGGLEQLSKLTREFAVLETVVDELDNPHAVMRYYLDNELGGDPTNFFAPNYKCLEYMLRDVGFKRFKFSRVAYPIPIDHERVVVHAWK